MSNLITMKIAVPTDDGIHITEESSARGFHVFTVELGEIADEEVRWVGKPSDPLSADLHDMISDCSVLLVKNTEHKPSPRRDEIKTSVVTGSGITGIILDYLASTVRQEANTCCCP
jgi:hypothetical protein